jgi:hypothetical protein
MPSVLLEFMRGRVAAGDGTAQAFDRGFIGRVQAFYQEKGSRGGRIVLRQ